MRVLAELALDRADVDDGGLRDSHQNLIWPDRQIELKAKAETLLTQHFLVSNGHVQRLPVHYSRVRLAAISRATPHTTYSHCIVLRSDRTADVLKSRTSRFNIDALTTPPHPPLLRHFCAYRTDLDLLPRPCYSYSLETHTSLHPENISDTHRTR